uniref:Uncharacterized protein n=1 Tax=Mantoniella antarctica TaxID=81844 RepID=A0A6U3F1P4_9CHLO
MLRATLRRRSARDRDLGGQLWAHPHRAATPASLQAWCPAGETGRVGAGTLTLDASDASDGGARAELGYSRAAVASTDGGEARPRLTAVELGGAHLRGPRAGNFGFAASCVARPRPLGRRGEVGGGLGTATGNQFTTGARRRRRRCSNKRVSQQIRRGRPKFWIFLQASSDEIRQRGRASVLRFRRRRWFPDDLKRKTRNATIKIVWVFPRGEM